MDSYDRSLPRWFFFFYFSFKRVDTGEKGVETKGEPTLRRVAQFPEALTHLSTL